ncbi:hypothetical protein IEE92_13580 [Kocuria sp. cx-116]|uniref:hypothetical protein n=1 Tax=Kocuria sp. cx-116 TaxID=2771378 RepID=UPI0016888DEB|nr:hypothetical protein [Kocuria sp. cx-116]MBD2763558.1 hypothetical protein [Kocuria sp. cx-116]
MAKLTDPQQAEEAAQRLLNDRMDYVRRAITARGALEDARDSLKEAEEKDVQAFQAAVSNGGWTENELRKIGLTAPEKVKRVQRRRKTTNSSAGTAAQDAPEQPLDSGEADS